MPKILFIGGTIRGLKLIEFLVKRKYRIVFAVIMPQEEHEPINVSTAIIDLCQRHKISFKIARRIKKEEVSELLEFMPDVAFVCGWRTLIPSELYGSLRWGCLAAHDSLLPKYRGFAPTAWAIINGEKKLGVTLFKIADGDVDSGLILARQTVLISRRQTATQIYPQIIKATVDLYAKFLKAALKGQVKWQKQNEAQATYGCRRRPEDGQIPWNQSAQQIFNLYRALTPPNPWSWTTYKNKKIYILKATLPKKHFKYDGAIPGQIVRKDKQGVWALCGQGQIILEEIMEDNKKTQLAKDYFAKSSATLGKVFNQQTGT